MRERASERERQRRGHTSFCCCFPQFGRSSFLSVFLSLSLSLSLPLLEYPSAHRVMGAFAAVVLTVVSSGGSAVGKAMQKQGTRSLPRLRLDPSVLREYLRCGPWMAGISLDVAGALLMVAALAQAPVRKGGGRGRKKTRKGERRRAMIPMLVFFSKNNNLRLLFPCLGTATRGARFSYSTSSSPSLFFPDQKNTPPPRSRSSSPFRGPDSSSSPSTRIFS